MVTGDREVRRGLAALRVALQHALDPTPELAGSGWLLSEVVDLDAHRPSTGSRPGSGTGPSASGDDSSRAASSEEDAAVADRLIGLVELARGGDAEAFGQLFDHYQVSVYRFVYYRVRSVVLAEDLTSETFFRALRSMGSFRWQGKDFGAWLMTIARNLTTDHFKAGRTRFEYTVEDLEDLENLEDVEDRVLHDGRTEGPETTVLASIADEKLLSALTELPHEQQECLIMRFLQGLSIAETARVLGRSDGAVKQLQLRGVRNLAKLLPEGL